MKRLHDEQVIAEFFENDPNKCFETLYARYVEKVYHHCLSFTHDSAAAEDYTQDIFLKAFAKLEGFQQRSSFSTWLYSIARNYCTDQLRHAKRLLTTPMDYDLDDNIADANESQAVEEQYQQLKVTLDQLPAEEITFLKLKYEDDLSIEELASRYQLTQSAVKMRLKRSRDKIYHLYQQRYAD